MITASLGLDRVTATATTTVFSVLSCIIIAIIVLAATPISAQSCTCTTFKSTDCKDSCNQVCSKWLGENNGNYWVTANPVIDSTNPYWSFTEVISSGGNVDNGDEWAETESNCPTSDVSSVTTMLYQNTTTFSTYQSFNPCHWVPAYFNNNAGDLRWSAYGFASQSGVTKTWMTPDCAFKKANFQKLHADCITSTPSCCTNVASIAQGTMSANGGSTKRQRACQRIGPLMGWRKRTDGSKYEDMFVPYRMRFATAKSFCNYFGSTTLSTNSTLASIDCWDALLALKSTRSCWNASNKTTILKSEALLVVS